MRQLHTSVHLEAIAIRTQNYKEKSKLITLYSKEQGLVTMIAYQPYLYLAAPMHVEVLARPTRSLWSLKEAHLLHTHEALRVSLPLIEATASIFQAIRKTQIEGHSAPDLFSLTLSYLSKLQHFKDLNVATLSFYLKLLRHEGSINPKDIPKDSFAQKLIDATTFSSLFDLQLPEKDRHFLTITLESIGKNA